MKNTKTSTCVTSICSLRVETGFLIWNRFAPRVCHVSESLGMALLEQAEHWENHATESERETLRNAYLTPATATVPKESFLNGLAKFAEHSKSSKMELFNKRYPFNAIQIFNEECNLDCPYCIMNTTWHAIPNACRQTPKRNSTITLSRIISILEQQYSACKKHGKDSFIFAVNGGEGLLHEELIFEAVKYIRETRKDWKTSISVNSNGTTVSNRVAEYAKKYKMQIVISIDGNRRHHDSTRKFKSTGLGSFDQAIQGHERLRNKCGEFQKLNIFQGTLANWEEFKTLELAELAEYGFVNGRLAPNLIGKDPKYGENAADLFFGLCNETLHGHLPRIYDGVFENFNMAFDWGKKWGFSFYCNGLNGILGLNFVYNLNRNMGSCMCQYVVEGSVPLEQVPDIFDTRILEASVRFQKKRLRVIEDKCLDCSIVGICRGGCILAGISAQNAINLAACNYLNRIWQNYLQSQYSSIRERTIT